MRSLTINILIGMLGIAVGAVGYAKISNPVSISGSASHIDSTSLPTAQKPQSAMSSTVHVNPSKSIDIAGLTPHKENPSAVQALSVSGNRAEEPGSLFHALGGTNFEMIESGEIDSVLLLAEKWFENSANPAREMFELLTSDTDDNTKAVLEYLLISGRFNGVTEKILNEMSLANESEHDGWGKLMEMASIRSSEERDAMFTVLPILTSESLVSATLNAIQPNLLPAAERTQLLDGISPYVNSENEDIKSAAMIALGNFGAHDYSYVIEEALMSGTEKVKLSAMYAASIGGMRTDTIKNQMSQIMQDESASFNLRAEAFNGLNAFNLDEHEYNLYYDFYRENILPLEQEANRG